MGIFLTTIFHLTPQVLYILETSIKIKFNEADYNHHDQLSGTSIEKCEPKMPSQWGPKGPRCGQRPQAVAEDHNLWPKATSTPQELE